MCGIAGIVGRSDRSAVDQMLCASKHRGPDDSGVFGDAFLTIGMNRLSIIDLSPLGHQPMRSDDGRYWIVYNGEIYNYAEIREKLKKRGHSFLSGSDTEVLLKAYIEFKEKCLDLFRGMFAFVIYDTHTREIFGARDRFGIKPFYYAYTKEGHFVFASEIKALLSSGYVDFSIDNTAFQQLLTFGSVLPDHCMVKNIKSLQPAHFFYYSNGKFNSAKYWRLTQNPSLSSISYDDAKGLLLDKLKESVSLRWISDRPVGLFLSSGIDSASILASTRLLGMNNVSTFTVGFVDDDQAGEVHDEARYAQKIASHLGFKNETVFVEGEKFRDVFNDFVLAIDQPSIDGLNTFLITKYARQHLVVALSGLGGDELMNGYLRDRAVKDWSAGTKIFPDTLVKFFNYQGYCSKGVSGKNPTALKFFKGVHTRDPVWNYFISRHVAPPSVSSLLMRNDTFNRGDWQAMFDSFDQFRLPRSYTIAQQISYLELNSYMSSQLLRDMDAVSMYNSMEVRFPLIDHQLAELIFNFPDSFKIDSSKKIRLYREGQYSYQEYGAKKILLDTFKDYLPKDYVLNKKRGFNLPVYKWLSKYFREEIIDTLSAMENNSTHFSPSGVKSLKEDFVRSNKANSLLWAVFLFAKWELAMKEKLAAAVIDN